MDIQCICPAKPDGKSRHATDTITLREKLDFRSCIALRNEVIALKQADPDSSLSEVLALLTEQYVVFGVESWSLADDSGPIPVTHPNVREYLLAHPIEVMAIGNEADERYSAVMLPLLMRASESSQPTPTDTSTSPMNGSSAEPPTPLKRSSTSTTPTDATEPTSTSPDGDSSSSRRSKSVA